MISWVIGLLSVGDCKRILFTFWRIFLGNRTSGFNIIPVPLDVTQEAQVCWLSRAQGFSGMSPPTSTFELLGCCSGKRINYVLLCSELGSYLIKRSHLPMFLTTIFPKSILNEVLISKWFGDFSEGPRKSSLICSLTL